ncbi:hypothetical protein O3W44_23690 [Pantoea sp. LMR881]|nr:hypothetical protein [Pantoea sp. LMR881]
MRQFANNGFGIRRFTRLNQVALPAPAASVQVFATKAAACSSKILDTASCGVGVRFFFILMAWLWEIRWRGFNTGPLPVRQAANVYCPKRKTQKFMLIFITATQRITCIYLT